jgi:hypothetical protein
VLLWLPVFVRSIDLQVVYVNWLNRSFGAQCKAIHSEEFDTTAALHALHCAILIFSFFGNALVIWYFVFEAELYELSWGFALLS